MRPAAYPLVVVRRVVAGGLYAAPTWRRLHLQ